jgi:hypothetical protein
MLLFNMVCLIMVPTFISSPFSGAKKSLTLEVSLPKAGRGTGGGATSLEVNSMIRGTMLKKNITN